MINLRRWRSADFNAFLNIFFYHSNLCYRSLLQLQVWYMFCSSKITKNERWFSCCKVDNFAPAKYPFVPTSAKCRVAAAKCAVWLSCKSVFA